MLSNFSSIIADFFVANNIIPAEEKAIYKYGIEVTLSTATGIIAIAIIGIFAKCYIECMIFLLCFITIRVYSGGYHADTFLKCTLTFICLFIAFLLTKTYVQLYLTPYFSVVIMIISATNIAVLAPIKNKHKLLTEKEKPRYKKISVAMSVVWTTVAIVLYSVEKIILFSVSITMFIIATLMVAEIIKQRRRNVNEK